MANSDGTNNTQEKEERGKVERSNEAGLSLASWALAGLTERWDTT